MMAASSSKFLLIVGLLLLALLLLRPTLNVAGYCWEEKRFLSDEEFIFKALEETYSDYPPQRYNGFDKVGQQPIEYKSFEEFVALNKNCCKLVDEASEGYRVPWIYKTRGLSATMVEVIYRVETSAGAKSGRGLPSGYNVIHPNFTNCGRLWNEV